MFSRLLLVGLLLATTLLLTSCIFGLELELFVVETEEGFLLVSLSSLSELSACEAQGFSSIFICDFQAGEQNADSRIILTSGELFVLQLLDPVVLQLPAEAANIDGSYAHQEPGSNAGGPLAIQAGLTSVRADVNRTLTAEPGTQLVVLDLPEGAPRNGGFAFNLNFRMPDDATELKMKALFTGKVQVDSDTYYPPLLPCTTDMASVPEFTVPLPAGGVVNPVLNQAAGCQNTLYQFDAPQPQPTRPPLNEEIFLPAVSKQPLTQAAAVR